VSARRVLPASRQDAIADHLRSTGSVTIAEVEALFDVSAVTVRRDLAELERRGSVRRTHGGAVLPATSRSEREDDRPEHEPELIRALAEAALAGLAPSESVFLDSSPASLEVARKIVDAGLPMTVLTNSARVVHLVFTHAAPGLSLIALGGILRRRSGSFVGPATVRAIGEHFADRLFLGVARVTPAGVLTEADPLEAEIKRAMIARSERATLLLDPTTLSGHGLIAVAEVAELAAVIAAGVAGQALAPVRVPGVAVTET
jgi:DeoR/GlpR family transcriptional regulator of sugar metabolism